MNCKLCTYEVVQSFVSKLFCECLTNFELSTRFYLNRLHVKPRADEETFFLQGTMLIFVVFGGTRCLCNVNPADNIWFPRCFTYFAWLRNIFNRCLIALHKDFD